MFLNNDIGVWIHPSKGSEIEFPWVNVVAGGPGSDSYFRPVVLEEFPAGINYRYIDQTVFVYSQDVKASLSSFSNDDVSSPSLTTDPWIMNSLLPLHRYYNHPLDFDRITVCLFFYIFSICSLSVPCSTAHPLFVQPACFGIE